MSESNRLKEKELSERYLIEKVLGEGGLGVVYKAYDKVLKIDVAIKTLQSQNDGQALVRLQREAMAAGKLKNENIARVFDFGQTAEGSPYMVMEFVPGITLADFIQMHENNRVDYLVAVPIFEQICTGLEHAHKNGIIHRDLKPSNVMLISQEGKKNKSNNYLVKLLDFGVAKIESDQKLTTNGAILGSPLYMSPEQTQGEDSTAQSDIYSFGCLAFETLCGIPPLKGDSPIKTMWMHKNEAPLLVSDILADDEVPKALVELIDQCLRKKASDRPKDVESIKKALNEITGVNQLSIQHFENLSYKQKTAPSPIKLPDWSHQSLLKLTIAASALGVLVLTLMYQHFQNTSLAKNEKLNESISDKDSEPISTDLSNLIGRNNNFEYVTSHEETTVETKKNTVDDDLEELKTTYLVSLKIKEGNITGSGFKYINKLPLRKIELRSDSIEPKYFRDLLPIKTLVSLRIDKNKADSNILSLITNFKMLEQLTLDSDLLEDRDFSVLATLPKLKKLKLSGKRLTDNLPDYLYSFGKLETLDLEHCKQMTENVGIKISRLERLRSINLPCRQSKKSFESLKKLKLKDLDVSELEFDSKEFQALCSIKSLKTLHMSNIRIEGANYSSLNNLKNLNEIDLSSEKICNQELFVTLAKLPVKRIDLSKSKLNARQLNVLIDNGRLDAINLESCKNISKKVRKEFQRVYEKRWNRQIEMDFNDYQEGELDQYKMDPAVFDVPR